MHLPISSDILCNILSQLSYNLALANLSWHLFEALSLFILRETTPEILGPWEELEFAAMGTILLIVFKFSTSSTTNYFYVFPTELKDRFLAILHVHRFRLSGSSNFLWFISVEPPSLLLVSLSFCYPSWYKYNINLL